MTSLGPSPLRSTMFALLTGAAINCVGLEFDIFTEQQLAYSRFRWLTERLAFSGASIKAIRTLICCLSMMRTLIVSPSTMPVMRPWIDTCSRPKVCETGVDASWPRTPERTSRARSLLSMGSGLREQ